MKKLLSHTIELREIADRYIPEFGRVFNRNMVRISERSLREELRNYAENIGAADTLALSAGATKPQTRN